MSMQLQLQEKQLWTVREILILKLRFVQGCIDIPGLKFCGISVLLWNLGLACKNH